MFGKILSVAIKFKTIKNQTIGATFVIIEKVNTNNSDKIIKESYN